jgi:hypothetical protein
MPAREISASEEKYLLIRVVRLCMFVFVVMVAACLVRTRGVQYFGRAQILRGCELEVLGIFSRRYQTDTKKSNRIDSQVNPALNEMTVLVVSLESVDGCLDKVHELRPATG